MHRILTLVLILTGFIMTRNQAIAETITKHGGARALAAHIPCSPNLLYRAALPEPSGCDISLGKIERLIEVTQDWRILDYLNHKFEFFKCPYPIMRASEMDIITIIERLQLAQIRVSMHARAYAHNPSEETKENLDMAVLNIFEICEGLRLQTKCDWEKWRRGERETGRAGTASNQQPATSNQQPATSNEDIMNQTSTDKDARKYLAICADALPPRRISPLMVRPYKINISAGKTEFRFGALTKTVPGALVPEALKSFLDAALKINLAPEQQN